MSDALVLALDAATYSGSVALLGGGRVLEASAVAMRGATEERLMPAIAELLSRARVPAQRLSGIACGGGPGSFTSLRIAASLAKGLAVSLGVPLFVASSLTLIVAADESLGPGDYQAQLDAMRGDAYVQRIRKAPDGRVMELTDAALSGGSEALERAARDGVVTIGGANAMLPRIPHARGFRVLLGEVASQVEVSSWEPLYGRLAEAQVQWERRHGQTLPVSRTP